ncbi:MAG: glycosyltransferase family 9 protein [Thermodesulfobacteriota bacterium]|nr:glycosyltransferase family 9 protein [Thermodesulfobacteriota bacterium]
MVIASPKTLKTAPSILIILMGSLGDLIRGLCLVSHIKNNLPGSRVTWLVEPAWAELVAFHPQIDKMIVFDRPGNIVGVWDLYKELSREDFDITIDLQRHFKSGFFSLLSGAKRRIGFNRKNSKELNWIFNNEHIEHIVDELVLPKWRHYLNFTEYLGLPEPDILDFGFSSLDIKSTAPRIIVEINDPVIAVVIGTSWESKEWFFKGYYELVKNILSSGDRQVVLLGDRSKTESAAKLSEKVSSHRLINLVGKTSLLELVAVLKAAVACVGPDSGPAHLAAAVGTPFVTLFGPTSPRRAAPYKYELLAVQSDINCVSCYKKKCPDLDRRCMRLISSEAVMEKLTSALAIRSMD